MALGDEVADTVKLGGNDMENECKWIFGKFSPCSGFSPIIKNYSTGGADIVCSSCGECVERPKPEIEKSGESWVASLYGKDYIFLSDSEKTPNLVNYMDGSISPLWEEIDKIDITDEIAKHRPMVTIGGRDLEMLIGVFGDNAYFCNDSISLNSVKIAKVKDIRKITT